MAEAPHIIAECRKPQHTSKTFYMSNQKDMSQPPPQQQVQINIEIDPAIAEGAYSNFAIINHSQAEFILDFTRLLPGLTKTKVHTRIIMTPQHAKMLQKALEQNISMYENTYGTIKVDGVASEQMGFHINKDQVQSR